MNKYKQYISPEDRKSNELLHRSNDPNILHHYKPDVITDRDRVEYIIENTEAFCQFFLHGRGYKRYLRPAIDSFIRKGKLASDDIFTMSDEQYPMQPPKWQGYDKTITLRRCIVELENALLQCSS